MHGFTYTHLHKHELSLTPAFVWILTRSHTGLHIQTHTPTYLHTHTSMYTYTFKHIHTHTHSHNTQLINTHTSTHLCIRTPNFMYSRYPHRYIGGIMPAWKESDVSGPIAGLHYSADLLAYHATYSCYVLQGSVPCKTCKLP